MHMLEPRNVNTTLNPVVVHVVSFNWSNITDEFFNIIKELKLGEILHDNLFGLCEAMSAIEMMDPKMDVGMLCNRCYRSPMTLSLALEKNFLKIEDIPYSDQLSVIDTTWACIVSWIDGHSLAQTVFTNLYLHNPHKIADKPLKSFCIGVFKIIDLIKEFIDRGLIFEKEDFQPMSYGYKLNPEVSEEKAIDLLTEAEEDLKKKRRVVNIDLEEEQDVANLILRIKFMRLFLMAFVGLNRKDVNVEVVSSSNKFLSNCLNIIPLLVKSVHRASPPAYISEIHGPVSVGFEPLVNQRLLPPTFPHYTRINSPTETYKRLEELIVRLRQVSKIVSCTSFNAALELMVEVNSTKPCIVPRSVMQFLFLPHCSRTADIINCFDLIKDSAKTFVSPPVLMPKSLLLNNLQVKEYVDNFLSHCVRPFSSLIQLHGHNSARQRSKLTHLLEEFANLQTEAERIDTYLHNLSQQFNNVRPHLACFGTWILYYTLRLMIMFLLSGFELELYGTHEYHYIFWYLYECLYGWLVSSLTRAESFLNDQVSFSEQNKIKKRNKSKQRKNPRPYAKEIVLNQALQCMCGGYYKAMVGFRKDGKIILPNPEFDSEKVRYEHRFSPFFSLLLTPPPVQYSEFKIYLANDLHHTLSQTLYLAGCKHFHQARTLLESLHSIDQEIKELIKIAKTNYIVLKLLASGHKLNSCVPPDFDFSVHRHFPIIKI